LFFLTAKEADWPTASCLLIALVSTPRVVKALSKLPVSSILWAVILVFGLRVGPLFADPWVFDMIMGF
jgi:hypothetical protein